MMLMAQELGLGTTWVGYFERKLVKTTFALPDNLEVVGFLPTGYKSANCEAHSNHTKRKDLTEIVTWL